MVKRDGRYVDVSWHEMWVDARKVARGLVALGLEPGDRACIVAATRIEWCTTDLGILAAGGVTVPIYPSNLADECQYVADHSGARVIFAENREQVAKFIEQQQNHLVVFSRPRLARQRLLSL